MPKLVMSLFVFCSGSKTSSLIIAVMSQHFPILLICMRHILPFLSPLCQRLCQFLSQAPCPMALWVLYVLQCGYPLGLVLALLIGNPHLNFACCQQWTFLLILFCIHPFGPCCSCSISGGQVGLAATRAAAVARPGPVIPSHSYLNVFCNHFIYTLFISDSWPLCDLLE